MNKLFHRLSTCILLGILLAAAISAVVYTAANGALKAFFQYYAMQPEVFQRLSDEHFADLQDFATENHIVSTDGQALHPMERQIPLCLPHGHPTE